MQVLLTTLQVRTFFIEFSFSLSDEHPDSHFSGIVNQSQDRNHINLSPSPFFSLSPEDSDYNPADEESKARPPPTLKKPAPPISSSSHGRPRRKVGRPRKYSSLEEGYNSKGGSLKFNRA